MTTTSIIGIPLDIGAENLGVASGPTVFRQQNIVTKLQSAGLTVADDGNIAPRDRVELKVGNPRLRYADEITRVAEAVATRSHELIKNGHHLIGLGGDHSVTLGLVAGVSSAVNGDLGVIYFDAHGDMNTDETTPTGNIHGMHVAALMGFGAPELTHVHGEQVKLQPANLLHVGGNDLDQAEIDLMQREHIPNFGITDLLKHNMAPLFGLIDDLAARVKHIYISLDLDAIDSLYAPGAGMPNQAGLTYREITTIADYIGRTCPVIGVDIVEYNPLQDEGGKTAELGIELIARFYGRNYSWYANYLAKNKL